jgi:hypothetical protein
MSLRKRRKESLPELKNPGDREPERCSPGSIEQQLDMCEEGGLRGDTILYRHGKNEPEYTGEPAELDTIMDDNWQVDLSEDDREGDELSGDDHASGLEGKEPDEAEPPTRSGGEAGISIRKIRRAE